MRKTWLAVVVVVLAVVGLARFFVRPGVHGRADGNRRRLSVALEPIKSPSWAFRASLFWLASTKSV